MAQNIEGFNMINMIMFIIIIIMFFQIQKISKNNNQENATNTESVITDAQLTAINNQISTIYNMDVEAIRNLGAISKSLLTGTNYHSTTVGTPGELTIPADKLIMNGSLSFLPVGSIIMWGLTQAAIPVGWSICDGTNNTPNLLDRFPVGAGQTYDVKSLGGSKTVSITTTGTLSVANIPKHTHKQSVFGNRYVYPGSTASYWISGGGDGAGDVWGGSSTKDCDDCGGTSFNTIGSTPFTPYYTAVFFIMRII